MGRVELMEQALDPHRWTRDEYARMLELGLLGEDDRVELLDGVIVEMTPEGADHGDVIQALTGLLAPAAAARRLRVQQPIAATADSEPEPDLAVVPPKTHRGHPRTADLAVEVVVSQHGQAQVKRGIYAAAGVKEYWVVDVPRRTVEVLTRPGPDGYAERRTLRGDDVLGVEEFGIRATVADVFRDAGLD